MNRFRFEFLNWRPDMDDVGNDGLSVADNVVHEPEGWKPVHLASATTFSTTGGLAASDAGVLSIVAKPVGASTDTFSAWITDQTTPALHVGINGVTATTTATGYPLSFVATSVNHEIYAFDVCEYAGKIIWTVEAQAEDASATALSIAFTGYMDY